VGVLHGIGQPKPVLFGSCVVVLSNVAYLFAEQQEEVLARNLGGARTEVATLVAIQATGAQGAIRWLLVAMGCAGATTAIWMLNRGTRELATCLVLSGWRYRAVALSCAQPGFVLGIGAAIGLVLLLAFEAALVGVPERTWRLACVLAGSECLGFGAVSCALAMTKLRDEYHKAVDR
jgi:hypothetical protein